MSIEPQNIPAGGAAAFEDARDIFSRQHATKLALEGRVADCHRFVRLQNIFKRLERDALV